MASAAVSTLKVFAIFVALASTASNAVPVEGKKKNLMEKYLSRLSIIAILGCYITTTCILHMFFHNFSTFPDGNGVSRLAKMQSFSSSMSDVNGESEGESHLSDEGNFSPQKFKLWMS